MRAEVAVSRVIPELNLQNCQYCGSSEIVKDFVVVTDFMMRLKIGKRIHLCEYEADSLAEGLSSLFEQIVEVPRIKQGRIQTLDTLISEEALLLAKYLRNERKDWIPRIPTL